MAEQFTAVEAWRESRRWRSRIVVVLLLVLVALIGLLLLAGVCVLIKVTDNSTPVYDRIEDHFKYGSIGAEPESGIPYAIWKTLPSLYPEEFGGRFDYAGFGFLYEPDGHGRQRDLPIGIAERNVRGVKVVWLNCATCHTGTWRQAADQPARIVPAMPGNNLDFHRFVRLVLRMATDDRLAPDQLFPAMERAGVGLGTVDRLIWRAAVLPRFREGLLRTRARLQPLLDLQSPWGPGRVDTFNPYKVLQFDISAASLTEKERIGVADLPAVFNQKPRQGMNLHWDGNNPSLAERNLSAAIGAGVTPRTVDHPAIERVAEWLQGLKPPPSPHRPAAAAVTSGQAIYRDRCAGCHGSQGATDYVFEGAKLGKVEDISEVGTDPARLDSYTEPFRQLQLAKLFAGTRYQFRRFNKTTGYANLPLDALWLRAPYLHNGSVPTLADLLKRPEERPKSFVRGLDVVDPVNGGFVAPTCDPSGPAPAKGFCFDTTKNGNRSIGHTYGVDLTAPEKANLLAYLLTF